MSNKLGQKVVIVGAGLAGLLAACKFEGATIMESGPRSINHKALLRFRDESVSTLTGIPFKRVTVDKGVWDSKERRLITGQCPLDVANKYSIKVSGGLANRSIRNLESEVRFIAPPDFQEQLQKRFNDQINYHSPFTRDSAPLGKPGVAIVSTAPLPALAKTLDLNLPADFERQTSASTIAVMRIPLAIPSDVYQTVYFPQRSLAIYRASITGDTLIIEALVPGGYPGYFPTGELGEVLDAFGLSTNETRPSEATIDRQSNGKIVDLPRDRRAAILYELTQRYNIYSLGRFACWRNIILDDVAKDIEKVSRLMDATFYSRSLNIFGNSQK